MILNYNYWYFVSALPEEVCDKIIETGLEKMSEAKRNYGNYAVEGTTGDWKAKSDLDPNLVKDAADITLEEALKDGDDVNNFALRDSEVSWLNDDWLYKTIWPFIHEANRQAGWNFDWDFTEDIQFTKYGLNQYYGHVTDNPQMWNKIRKLSVTISLSDPNDYTGGNLKFDLGPHRPDRYHECEEIRPRGSIVVFPSHIYHQVTPVTSGTRYSLVCWSLGKPWK
jgi:PKHD-type hydroxylase